MRQPRAMTAVMSVRRIAVIVALLAAFASAQPAAAHSCASPVWIEPGRLATVNIGVAAEQAPISSVEITVPSGFVADRVPDVEGWASAKRGAKVTFTGGSIPAYGCGYFSLTGTAPRKATLAFPLTVRSPDGSVRRYTSHRLNDPYSAQLVYAGVDPTASASGGIDVARTAQAAALVVSGLAAAWWYLRRARRSATRPPQLAARRSAGRGRGRRENGSSQPAHRTRRPSRRS